MSRTKQLPAVVPTAEIVSPAETYKLRLESMPSDELRDELRSALQMTAESLRRVAMIIRVLEDRGEDLSSLRIGLLSYLRQIAHGRVMPEVVIHYAQSPMLLHFVSELPVVDQRRLVEGELVEIAVWEFDGTIVGRRVDPLQLSRSEAMQLFHRGRLRPLDEQSNILRDRRGKRRPAETATGKIRADRKRGGLMVGRTLLDPTEVLAGLATLHEESPADDESEPVKRTKVIGIKLTEEEHKRLRVRSAETDIDMEELGRMALKSAGLI